MLIPNIYTRPSDYQRTHQYKYWQNEQLSRMHQEPGIQKDAKTSNENKISATKNTIRQYQYLFETSYILTH